MAEHNGETTGPDLVNEGLAAQELHDGGMAAGHVDGEQVLLVRAGDRYAAIGATCTHYGGPLHEGVFDGRCVRCPWHHARFNVFNGKAEAAPALNPVTSYEVSERDGRLFVTPEPRPAEQPSHPPESPERIVILGGGAAGSAAAVRLRELGYEGSVTVLSSDSELPYDRPNLSKDFLAGDGGEDWLPLWPEDFYDEHNIEFRLNFNAARIDRQSRQVVGDDGAAVPYDRLLIATGARPNTLDIPGADQPHVHYLRTAAQSRAIISQAESAGVAIVIGASFIGLEVAASLTKRDVRVTVVAPDDVPMARVLGEHFGSWVRSKHEENGVEFRLGHTVSEIGSNNVKLDDGTELPADMVVIGVGVSPVTDLAREAGLEVNRGVVVNSYLCTSDPNIWAAGDVAEWPDPVTAAPVRVEHWVVAQRHGQLAARNILGMNERFSDAPFFWSQHYDIPIAVVGIASGWDHESVDGNAADSDVLVTYSKDGRVVGGASIFRDQEILKLEMELEDG